MDTDMARKRGRPVRSEPHLCECGYSTTFSTNMKRHKNTCHVVKQAEDYKDFRIEMLSQQNKQLTEQLAAKDEQIKQLIKRPPRTINNRFIVNNNVNCFGRESLSHIPESKYQELLRDPETSVARVVALQRSIAENDNVTVPNIRERRWLIVEEEDGEKQWRSRDKGLVLEQMWESGTCLLEGEADEETPVGARWYKWADKVRSSIDDKGKLYREQLDMVEHCILDSRS